MRLALVVLGCQVQLCQDAMRPPIGSFAKTMWGYALRSDPTYVGTPLCFGLDIAITDQTLLLRIEHR
jgi:hypothetical protein